MDEMTTSEDLVSRRAFLEGLGLSTAGLLLGFGAGSAFGQRPTTEPGGATGAKPATSSTAEEMKSTGLNPNVFVHVAPSGLVSLVCHRSEMGQGIRSSLPVLLADEMGADPGNIKILQADGDRAYGDQNTDGSNSIRGIYEDMRRAAATARVMLTAAAAKRWEVAAEDCDARDGYVVHGGRKLSFGELALEAGALAVPAPGDVRLRAEKELKIVGKALPLRDGPDYVKGTAVFGADLRAPGMLVAVIARPPVVGGKVARVDKSKALAVSGVKKVIAIPSPKAPYRFQPWGGVAVLAENTWAAIRGRDALKIAWNHGPNAGYDSKTYRKTVTESARAAGKTMREKGDVERALSTAKRTIDAEYYVPHLPHAPMEPPAALAVYHKAGGGSCEVWAPTQNPQAARTEVARVLEIPEDRVTVHVTMLGGGFGRKSKADFVSEAAFLSKKAGVPVRVQFTRQDDLHNDYLNTVNAQRLTAGLDDDGKVIAWRHRTAYPPIKSLFDGTSAVPSADDLQQGVLDFALDVPNLRAEACHATAHVRTGWLRSVYNIFHAFAINSFIDEIAHARGRDPRDVLLELIGPDRKLSLADLGIAKLKNYGQPLAKHPVDAGRLRRVIERVTEMAPWSERVSGKGRALGLAAHRSFLSYVGVVAAVKKVEGEIRVDEVWVAVDAGRVINTDRVVAQMEGSVIHGMNHFLYGGVTHKAGAVEQSNFDRLRLVRMGTEPRRIHVEIVDSDAAPGGVGEPGVPPVAPAIANAVFALTGKRVRELPLGAV